MKPQDAKNQTKKSSSIQSKKQMAERLTLSALMIALGTFVSFLCSLIPLPWVNFPFGGGITLASMLPVVLIAYMYGTKWGLFTAFTYSIMQMILGVSTVSSLFMPGSDSYTNILNAFLICFIDYVLAYTLLGFGGVFRSLKSKNGKDTKYLSLILGVLLALSLRYVAHVISGAIFYGAWAEWFFTDTVIAELAISAKIMQTFSGTSLAIVYSVIYNGCYMIPEMAITCAAAVAAARLPLIKKK